MKVPSFFETNRTMQPVMTRIARCHWAVYEIKDVALNGPPETAGPVTVQKQTSFGDGTRDLHVTGVTLVQSLYQM